MKVQKAIILLSFLEFLAAINLNTILLCSQKSVRDTTNPCLSTGTTVNSDQNMNYVLLTMQTTRRGGGRRGNISRDAAGEGSSMLYHILSHRYLGTMLQ